MKEPEKVDISQEEIASLLERLEANNLNNSDITIITRIVQCYFWIQLCLQEAKMSIKRLRALFGSSSSEKRKNLAQSDSSGVALEAEEGNLPEMGSPDLEKEEQSGSGKEFGKNLLDLSPFIDSEDEDEKNFEERPFKGHGRLGHEAYEGATIEAHPHESLKPRDPCPEGCGGKVYFFKPKVVVCLQGNSLISAKRHILERLRCSLCGAVFTASPANLSLQKHDESVKAQVAIAKFYMGMPNYRLEKWQNMIGVPLRDSTQWDLIKSLADDIGPVYSALEKLAAQGKVIAHDDTSVRILSCIKENKTKQPGERTGMFTTSIVSQFQDYRICLFYPGRKHSGENIADLMSMRPDGLEAFIRMCDALSSNLQIKFLEILCICLTHGRRKFYEIHEYFPEECGCVIDALALVYKYEGIAKKKKMSPEERLAYHQEKSAPIFSALKDWIVKKIEEKDVEPNSSLGKAFKYMMNHWEGLTNPNSGLENRRNLWFSWL